MQPGESLLLLLERLRTRLSTSGVERTTGLLLAKGNDCPYYRKSLDIFLDQDYDQLKQLVDTLHTEFARYQGPSHE
jgi:hypothetical protein